MSELPPYEIPQPLFSYEIFSSLNKVLNVNEKVFGFIKKVRGVWDFFQAATTYWLQYCQPHQFGKIKIFLTGGNMERTQDSSH